MFSSGSNWFSTAVSWSKWFATRSISSNRVQNQFWPVFWWKTKQIGKNCKNCFPKTILQISANTVLHEKILWREAEDKLTCWRKHVSLSGLKITQWYSMIQWLLRECITKYVHQQNIFQICHKKFDILWLSPVWQWTVTKHRTALAASMRAK